MDVVLKSFLGFFGRGIGTVELQRGHPPVSSISESSFAEGEKWKQERRRSAILDRQGLPQELQTASVDLEKLELRDYHSFVIVARGAFLPDVASLPDPVVDGEITSVMILQEAYERKLLKNQHALIARINTRGIILQETVNCLFSVGWIQFEIISLDKDFFFSGYIRRLIFFLSGNMELVGVVGLVFIFSAGSLTSTLRSSLFRIIFNGFGSLTLPLEYLDKHILFSIAKAIGHPISMDRRTEHATLGHFVWKWRVNGLRRRKFL
ncbi:hypothetical protein NE237_028610 [Protea cynaroides]|uniref:Uncharacterized protein n=1 Tax=Protea cynaroides TaxID=273540 RepID=A0A9Q0GQ80_9MAGN|nr:hypothetical protein NE237_028610 [Protea cynaroides]